jgi:single-stranded DNA-binding protein
MNNSITIVGHVGQKPTTKTFEFGKKVVRFSVAVKDYSTAKEDPQTMWIDVQGAT